MEVHNSSPVTLEEVADPSPGVSSPVSVEDSTLAASSSELKSSNIMSRCGPAMASTSEALPALSSSDSYTDPAVYHSEYDFILLLYRQISECAPDL